jgi:hypothetical protein
MLIQILIAEDISGTVREINGTVRLCLNPLDVRRSSTRLGADFVHKSEKSILLDFSPNR